MAAYQDWLSSNYPPVLEYKLNEASGNIANTGSAGSGMDLTANGTPTYQNAAGQEYEQEVGSWAIEMTGGATASTADGFYKFNHSNWGSTLSAWTMIFINKDMLGDSGDNIFCVSDHYSSITGGSSVRVWSDAGELAIQLRNAGTLVFDHTVSTSDSMVDNAYAAQTYIITQPGDGTGPRIYINGIYKGADGRFESITNPDWSFDDFTPVSTCLGGLAISLDSGATLDSINTPMQTNNLEYVAVCSGAMTDADVHAFNQQYYGGGTITTSTTRTGRNRLRRYWTNQVDGGALPSGLESIDSILIGGGSSADYYQAHLRIMGTDRMLNMVEDDEWTEFYGENTRGTYNTLANWIRMSPDGKWMGLADSTTQGPGTSSMGMQVWQRGYWSGAHDFFDGIVAYTGIRATWWAKDSDYVMMNHSARAPTLWAWDSDSERWRSGTEAATWQTLPTKFGQSSSYDGGAFGQGEATKNYVAVNTTYTASTTSGHWIYELNRSNNQLEDVTYTTRAIYGGHSAYVAPVREHIFFGFQSTASTPHDTNNSQIYCYKRTGAKTWESDATLLNNGVAHPDQSSDNTTVMSFLCIGDDLYAALSRAINTTPNLLHWRWNGSYYAAQSSVPWLGTGSYSRLAHGMACSSDGKFFMLTCNNAGSGSGHPSILAYSRNTTTGALTLLDTPHPFRATDGVAGDGYILQSSDNDWTSQSYYCPTLRESIPTPAVSQFVQKALTYSTPTIWYNFREASGTIDQGGVGDQNDGGNWASTVEGTGHTYEVVGGDQGDVASKAVTLDGNGGWIRGTPGTQLDSSSSGCFWICAKFTSAANTVLWHFSNAADDGTQEVVIGVNGSNQMYIQTFDAVGSIGTRTDGGGYNDGEYHIWCFIKSGSTYTCWVDNSNIGNTGFSSTYWFNNIVPGTNCDHIGIGGSPNAAGTALTSRFTGTLDFLGYSKNIPTSAVVERLSAAYLLGK